MGGCGGEGTRAWELLFFKYLKTGQAHWLSGGARICFNDLRVKEPQQLHAILLVSRVGVPHDLQAFRCSC